MTGSALFWVVAFLWLGCYPLLMGGPLVVPPQEAHWIAAAAALLAVVPRLWRAPRVSLGVPAAATLVALLSLHVAVFVNRDVFPAAELRWTALTGTAHGLFFLAALSALPRPHEGAAAARATGRLLAATLLAVAVGQGVLVWLGAEVGDPNWRPKGSLGNPNMLGAVAGALALSLAALGRWRWRGLVVALPLVLLLLATRSRGAALAFGVVAAVLAWRRFGWRALLLMAAGAALLVFVPNPLWERITSLRPEHAFSRPFLWGTALENLAGAPFGIGPGMNRFVFPAHAWDPEAHWLLHQRHSVGLTHNVLLTLGLEWGWAALAATLGLLAWAVTRLWSARGPDALRQAGALGAAVLFLEALVDALAQNPVVLTLCLVLAALALTRLPRGADPATGAGSTGLGSTGSVRSGTPGVSGRMAALGALLAAGAVLFATARHHAMLVDIREVDALLGRHAAGQHEVDEVRAELAAVVDTWPDEPAAWTPWLEFEEARLRERLDGATGPASPTALPAADVERVRRVMAGARHADPADVRVLRRCADILLLLHRRLEGRDRAAVPDTPLRRAWFATMDELLARDPLDVDARLRVALEAREAGRPELRDAAMAEVLRLEPDHAWAWLIQARTHEFEGRLEQALHAWLRTREALLNCRLHAQADDPRSRRFYEQILERVDLAVVHRRIVTLRRQLYF